LSARLSAAPISGSSYPKWQGYELFPTLPNHKAFED
jgi:hypothetical protein